MWEYLGPEIELLLRQSHFSL